jgi:hypothetical protein
MRRSCVASGLRFLVHVAWGFAIRFAAWMDGNGDGVRGRAWGTGDVELVGRERSVHSCGW